MNSFEILEFVNNILKCDDQNLKNVMIFDSILSFWTKNLMSSYVENTMQTAQSGTPSLSLMGK